MPAAGGVPLECRAGTLTGTRRPAFGGPRCLLAVMSAPASKREPTGGPSPLFIRRALYDTLLNSVSPRASIARTRPLSASQGSVILNAVKCLPPANKTLPGEEATCRAYLLAAVNRLPRLTTFVALGKVAHDSLCRSFGLAPSKAKFAHGAEHRLPDGRRLIDSYHCSRYNQNTRRLDAAMFESVFARAVDG